MTYEAAVIASNPQNYWRFNEGPGATAVLDYGNEPGMLWPTWVNASGLGFQNRSGYGYGGITADGGAMDCGGGGVWSLVQSTTSSLNPYVPLPDPGALEFWFFDDSPSAGFSVGWVPGSGGSGSAAVMIGVTHNLIALSFPTGQQIVSAVTPLSQWHHVAASWGGGTGFLYLDGTQVQPITYVPNIGGQHVEFFVGPAGRTSAFLNQGGLISEVATYRTALSAGDLDGHFDQAELKGQRPHWIGPRVTVTGGGGVPLPAYSVGATHLNLSGTASLQIPTGLRGVLVTIVATPPNHRQLAGNPPYDWDVGWVTVSDSNGMLVQQRITRDHQVWLDERIALGTSLGYFLEPGYVVNLSELDPAA